GLRVDVRWRRLGAISIIAHESLHEYPSAAADRGRITASRGRLSWQRPRLLSWGVRQKRFGLLRFWFGRSLPCATSSVRPFSWLSPRSPCCSRSKKKRKRLKQEKRTMPNACRVSGG